MSAPSPPAAPPSLRERSLRAVPWLLLFHGGRLALLLSVPILLARLSGLVELGLAELTLAIYAVASPCVEIGTGAAIVQRPQVSQPFLTSVFLLNAAMGLTVGCLLGLAGPPLVFLLGADVRMVPLLRWMALCLAVSSLSIVQAGMLNRRMAFGAITTLNTVAAAIGLAGSALAVWARLGAFAVIVGIGLYVGVNTAGLWVVGGWRPSLPLALQETRGVLRFGLTTSASGVLDNLGSQLERFLIGGFLGTRELGLYGAANNVVRAPLRHLMQVTDRILFPGLASVQADPARARWYYRTAIRYELALFAPAVVFLGVFAPELVSLVYGPGPQWKQAILPAQLLAVVALRMATAHTVGAVFLAMGRPDVQLRWTLYALGLTTTYFLAGSSLGVAGVAGAIAGFGFFGWLVSHQMANRLLGLGTRDFLTALAPPTLAATALTVALVAARLCLAVAGLTPSVQLVAASLLPALALYAACLFWLDAPLARGITRALAEILGHRPAG
jgi:O-antigen/teichoic acid export membrane protein